MGVKINGIIAKEVKKALKDKELIKVIFGFEYAYNLLERGEELKKKLLDKQLVQLLRKRYEGLELETLLALFIDNYGPSTMPRTVDNEISTIIDNKVMAIALELLKFLK